MTPSPADSPTAAMARAADGGADAGESGSCSGQVVAGDDDSAVSSPELPAPVSGSGGGDLVVWEEDKAERREIDASGSRLLVLIFDLRYLEVFL